MDEIITAIRAYDESKAKIQAGEETILSKVVYMLLDGENHICVWREYRGLTQQQLAKETGISKAYLSHLESGEDHGITEVMKNLAKALNLDLEDLVDTSVN